MTDRPPGDAGRAGRRRTVSITTALAAGFGALIAVGMAVVQGIALWTAQENTFELLAANARLAIQSLSAEVRRQLEPVEEVNRYVVRLIDTGQVDVNDRRQMEETLLTAVAGTRQVFGMAFLYSDGHVLRVRRGRGAFHDRAEFADRPAAGPPVLRAAAREPASRTAWGPPVWIGGPERTLLTVRSTIRTGDEFQGVLLSSVGASDLSREIARSDALAGTGRRFILYDRTHVLAHRGMADGGWPRGPGIPLPRLDQVGDPVLAGMWDPAVRSEFRTEIGDGVEGHALAVGDGRHAVLHRALEGFGRLPLTVGVHIGPEDGLGLAFDRLAQAAAAGVAVTLLCIAAAVLVGRLVSTPVRALASGSRAIAALDLDRVGRLRRSRLRELDEAASAFNRMTSGLRWFQNYVPRPLVRRLVEQDAEVVSEERRITVMFTDLAGFTTLSERMSAGAVVGLLNAHFSIVVGCIEAEGGIVDKYIGDSVMAFWDDGDGGVDRALRAGRAIRAGMRGFDGGGETVRTRIGVHTGRAIVGNIGPEGRVNYTVIGDTVNVAARLEGLGKEIAGDSGTAVLVSGEAAALAADRDGLAFRGRFAVRGRGGGVDVYELVG